MRIIAGDARGRKLIAPPGAETRPTADKARGALYNILGSRVFDARVLDLFGGTGAMALEAVSRGAAQAVIVDTSREAIRAIERNAEAVAGTGWRGRVRVIQADYRAAIGGMRESRFDIVILDPPYRMTGAPADAMRRLKEAGLLAPGCLIVTERARETETEYPEGFECFDTRRYGAACFDLLREAAE